MLLCYITDRKQFAGDERARRRTLLAKIAEAARCGVDYIHLREKDLSSRELQSLAREAIEAVRNQFGHSKPETGNSKLLINSRTDIALATGADGVHLPSGDLAASEVRAIWDCSKRDAKRETRNPLIGVSCHSLADVLFAESHGADFAVFAPVFEKEGHPGVGLDALRAACRRTPARDGKTEAAASGHMPVFALGGVTAANACACIEAGAAGIAGIRLFQENEIAEIVAKLRRVS